MDGFKNSTRTQYMKGGACDGYAKGGSVKGAAKISKVMGEFKRGELHSGSKKGPEVTSEKQATAIALSEARKAGAKIPVKKEEGGVMRKREGTGKPAQTGLARAAAMSGRTMPTPGKPAARKGVPVDTRKALIGGPEAADVYMARLPRGSEARRPPEPSVPSYKPGTRSGLKGGGLAVMPKGKK